MHISFHGGVREVTGSMHLLDTGTDRILMDCGMFQGRRKESNIKNRAFPFDGGIISNMVLSHAHIDHSGRIPVLTRENFKGRIVCTRATADACRLLLLDSAYIQESDAEYLNYKTLRHMLYKLKSGDTQASLTSSDIRQIKQMLKKDRYALNTETINALMAELHLERVEPLYTISDAEHALTFLEGHPYQQTVTVGHQTTCRFYDAGHILGAAITGLRVEQGERARTIMYTGDIGRFDKPILKNPAHAFGSDMRDVDLLIMESTYGDRLHEPIEELKPALQRVIEQTVARGGALLIPAFAYGRTQELIYYLHELYNEGVVPRIPIFVDSPLAIRLTRVFVEHPEVYDRETHATFLEQGLNPFQFKQLHFIETVKGSMALMRAKSPHIVISAAGMCEAGRILHHLRYKIHNPANTILIVGYMARHTLGRRILELGEEYAQQGRKGKPPEVRILNKTYPLAAHVVRLGGFSAHADRDEMLHFLQTSNLNIKQIAVVHGEADQSDAFVTFLRRHGYQASSPFPGETITLA